MSETDYDPKARPLARRAAVRALAKAGSERVPALCRILDEDRDPDVRLAVVEELGRVGDSRAIEPLMRALRGTFSGKRAFYDITFASVRFLLVGLLLAFWLWMVIGQSWMACIHVVFAYLHFSRAHSRARQERSAIRSALAAALASISEREPSPVVRAVIGDLKTIARDVLQQDARSRDACVKAAEQIDRATRDLERLPVAVEGLVGRPDQLPRAAEAPEGDERQLPVVRG